MDEGRSRRKNVSRVNYAEDKFDDSAISAATSATSTSTLTSTKTTTTTTTSANGRIGKTGADNSSSSPKKNAKSSRLSPNGSPGASEQNGSEKFALNWQKKIPENELSSYLINLDAAKVVKGTLRLKDGTTFGPEGG